MVAAIIVAAGSGTRMGEGTDKLFLELAGRPVVGHTWARFDGLPEIDEIVLVIRGGRQGEFEELGCFFLNPSSRRKTVILPYGETTRL